MGEQPREHRLDTPEGDICWFEWGSRSDRPSLLLLHATGFHARLWDQLVAALPAGTHVVAPDHRGHGRSYRPATLANWAANADVLLPLLDGLGGHPIVGAGHSMGAYILTRLAAQRPAAFAHLVLIDPVIMDPALYEGEAARPIPDPAEHPVARRRNAWPSAEAMRTRFADRPPYANWDPRVLADYCTYGLLPAADGDGVELACPPALEASVYQNALRTNPHEWLHYLAAPSIVIRAPTGERGGPLDFSLSPTWTGLGAAIGAERDELWAEHSHFIPMEAPARVAALLAERL
ncbi:alpha/beta hydrolase [Sphingopyxis sp. RIFCSPHIGHO2_12_FULL_65_19]|uniref:alpha/beta hydrolase n=1 Tax=Sphingopyxis sp. RIFCSPHIGHO2_12_FULL_65_19 TaxID=1802172 RepID=UPI0008C42356|nr:alpha/beta hydrolase [Sphingopyxis sp. RIFCSPHIGHO2_12_FULL_65_19]OHD05020.1 MAG: alpha/beta hydrolase [Sphingopyxis sp. RIFCSPHIGHO2_12_FULL_65_19]